MSGDLGYHQTEQCLKIIVNNSNQGIFRFPLLLLVCLFFERTTTLLFYLLTKERSLRVALSLVSLLS